MWETRSVFQGVWEGAVLGGFPHPVSFHTPGSCLKASRADPADVICSATKKERAWLQKNSVERRRRAMVAAVRQGESIRSVARRFRFSFCTVHRWVNRAQKERLDRVDWSDHLPGPLGQPANRISQDTEEEVLKLRRELEQTSDLGEYGDVAIRRELVQRGQSQVPSVRTIGRILERRGVLDGRRRARRPPPPRGWYLPRVGTGKVESDSVDIVSGLVIEGGIDVEILNAISLHGGLTASWPRSAVTAQGTALALLEHWRQVGLPGYAQFDNDTRFQGAHQYPDNLGRVTRLCLSLQVTPVFTPPRETGFQAAIESYNGRWQAKVWRRFHFDSLQTLQDQSARFVAATRARAAERILAAPLRQPFPNLGGKTFRLIPQAKSSSSDEPMIVAKSACSATPSPSTNSGLTASSVASSTSTPTPSVSTPSDDDNQSTNPCSLRSLTNSHENPSKADLESLTVDNQQR
jgi:transposase